MKKRIMWITETAFMLALLITLQLITKPLGQGVTGTLVNAVLAVTTLVTGLAGGLSLAIISPVLAFVFGIAPNLVTVVPIMLGNSCYVVLLHLFLGKSLKPAWKPVVGVITAAGVKFAVLYLLVVEIICGIASGALLGKKLGETVLLASPMLKVLPVTFAWPQLFTALAGGALALLIAPVLKKALHK